MITRGNPQLLSTLVQEVMDTCLGAGSIFTAKGCDITAKLHSAFFHLASKSKQSVGCATDNTHSKLGTKEISLTFSVSYEIFRKRKQNKLTKSFVKKEKKKQVFPPKDKPVLSTLSILTDTEQLYSTSGGFTNTRIVARLFHPIALDAHKGSEGRRLLDNGYAGFSPAMLRNQFPCFLTLCFRRLPGLVGDGLGDFPERGVESWLPGVPFTKRTRN